MKNEKNYDTMVDTARHLDKMLKDTVWELHSDLTEGYSEEWMQNQDFQRAGLIAESRELLRTVKINLHKAKQNIIR